MESDKIKRARTLGKRAYTYPFNPKVLGKLRQHSKKVGSAPRYLRADLLRQQITEEITRDLKTTIAQFEMLVTSATEKLHALQLESGNFSTARRVETKGTYFEYRMPPPVKEEVQVTGAKMPNVFRNSLGAYADEELAVLHFANDNDGYAARRLMNREKSLSNVPRDVSGPTILIVPREALPILNPILAKNGIVPNEGAFLDTDALSSTEMAELRKIMLEA